MGGAPAQTSYLLPFIINIIMCSLQLNYSIFRRNFMENKSHMGLFTISLASLITSVNAVEYIGLETAQSLFIVGGLGLGASVYRRFITDKYKTLFEGLGLKKNDRYPFYKRCEHTLKGKKLYFTLPPGMSSFDFEKHIDAIAQYFNVQNADITYANHNVILQLIEKELKTEYEFNLYKSKMEVPILLGHSYKEIVCVDLADGEPHIGIFGETGGGKSTLLRAIITNIICTTKNLKLSLIDCKRGVEFKMFRDCKQVTDFATNRQEAKELLSKIYSEVERRYDLFEEADVVDLKEYNQKYPKKKLDRKLIIVDEFAQLREEKEINSTLIDLAAIARASGVHLLLCTQRPSVKVIDGDIQANIPRVVGMKVKNNTNSVVVLGHKGLEDLRGKGHCILRSEGKETEIQAMNITPSQARELIKPYIINKPKTKVKKQEEKQGEVNNLSDLKELIG